MAEIFEIMMIVSFGASWPLNVIKSYRARTTKGKSIGFLYLIFFGYIAGIISKLVNDQYIMHFQKKWYVLFFYILNLLMVSADLILYYRNKKYDMAAGGTYGKHKKNTQKYDIDGKNRSANSI